MPRKIRDLIRDLETAGFYKVPGGKGSHRKFAHPKIPHKIIIPGKNGDDAKPYLEKQIKIAIQQIG